MSLYTIVPEEWPDKVSLTEPVTEGGFYRVVLHYASGHSYDSLFAEEPAARRFASLWEIKHV
ncbi:MAG: hypothetical protein ABIJ57_12505 [Pseudomonadota bacterium]|uniref:Uncharacterized protein n=1 Tax=viral metagenome TaxID=1070528 RepID=A0A6M3LNN2_9ZZZZ